MSDRILHTFFCICFYCDRNCHLPKYFLYKCPQISKTVQYVPPTSVTDGGDIWNCKMPVWRAEPSNVVVLPRDNIVFSIPGRFWKINQFLLSSPMFMALVLLFLLLLFFYLKVSAHFQCPLVPRHFLWSANNASLDVTLETSFCLKSVFNLVILLTEPTLLTVWRCLHWSLRFTLNKTCQDEFTVLLTFQTRHTLTAFVCLLC